MSEMRSEMADDLAPVAPKHVRYIKLGGGGKWARPCFDRGEIWFGHRAISHSDCVNGDWKAIVNSMVEAGRKPGKASDFVREAREFYTLGSECLWITFAEGKLWWTFAHPEIRWNPRALDAEPSRIRTTIDGWRCTNVRGEELRIADLSTKLTQTAAYQQTLCGVRDQEYLIRKINGVEEPLVAEASLARRELLAVGAKLIERLHWADFEVLAELLFTRSGWQRTSRLGGNQKDVDFILDNPTISERAFVQVKSRASQAVLDQSIARFRESGMDRFYFVCHSDARNLKVPDEGKMHIWTGQQLAGVAIKLGFFDWLIKAIG